MGEPGPDQVRIRHVAVGLNYIAELAEKAALADEVIGHVTAGRIRIEINQRYALQDAEQATATWSPRKTTGSSIL